MKKPYLIEPTPSHSMSITKSIHLENETELIVLPEGFEAEPEPSITSMFHEDWATLVSTLFFRSTTYRVLLLSSKKCPLPRLVVSPIVMSVLSSNEPIRLTTPAVGPVTSRTPVMN